MAGADIAGLVVVLVFAAPIYFLPSLVARFRRHPNRRLIYAINLFLGWLFIGWILALALAVFATTPGRMLSAFGTRSGRPLSRLKQAEASVAQRSPPPPASDASAAPAKSADAPRKPGRQMRVPSVERRRRWW